MSGLGATRPTERGWMPQRCNWCTRRTTNSAKRRGLCGTCFRMFESPPPDPEKLFSKTKANDQAFAEEWNQKFRDSQKACRLGLCGHGRPGQCWFRRQEQERGLIDSPTVRSTPAV